MWSTLVVEYMQTTNIASRNRRHVHDSRDYAADSWSMQVSIVCWVMSRFQLIRVHISEMQLAIKLLYSCFWFVSYVFLVLLLAGRWITNSVSLDPDEDKRDSTIFDGLKSYLLDEMSDEECQYFKTVTLRNLAKRAQSLKAVRPPRGLSFSLQQQRTYSFQGFYP